MRRTLILILSFILGIAVAHADFGEPLNTATVPANQRPKNLRDVYVSQNLGTKIPGNLIFTDELGKAIPLKSVLNGKPILLTLAYFKCPGLCTLVLTGVVDAVKNIPEKLGKDYQIVTVSIDPNEKFPLARSKKRSYLARYGVTTPSDDAEGWRMLTGDDPSIHALAKAVGFHYLYDKQYEEYSHPSVLMVLTPDGTISQYLFGIHFKPAEVAEAVHRASESKIGRKLSAVLLYCFHYDPLTGKYSLRVMQTLRVLALLTALAVGTFVIWPHLPNKRAVKKHVAQEKLV